MGACVCLSAREENEKERERVSSSISAALHCGEKNKKNNTNELILILLSQLFRACLIDCRGERKGGGRIIFLK